LPPVINKEKCIGCGICAEICPCDALHMVSGEDVPQITYPEECWHCNACVLDCPVEAVKLRVPLPASMLYLDAHGEGHK
jgi:adenylylsulfate reductase, subunit B